LKRYEPACDCPNGNLAMHCCPDGDYVLAPEALTLIESQAATLERVRAEFDSGEPLEEWAAISCRATCFRIRDALSSPAPDPRGGGMNWSQVAPRVAQVTGDTPEQVRAKGAAMAAEWAATAPDPRDARIAELESELERRREYTAEYVRRAEAAESRVRELEAALQEGEAMWLKQAATIARLRMTLDSESAVCAAELARRAAEGSVTPATPEHCCGLSGFNPMLGDECPACRYWARRAAEGGK
jgi:hypothetical protein